MKLMNKRIIIFTLVFSIIHFISSMITIYNGFIIFHGPSTPSEIFWACAMSVMIFPANIIFEGSASELVQTIAIILNSLFWGAFIAGIYLLLQKRFKSK